MMSLRPAIPAKHLLRYIPSSQKVAPLVVKFSKDCVPLGCFSSTISCLMFMYDWRLTRSDDGSPECLAHNVVSLYDPKMPIQILVVDMANHLEIHVSGIEGIDQHILNSVCIQTRETVFSDIKKVFHTMHLSEIEISHAFLCPCDKHPQGHSASTIQYQSDLFLRCSMTKKNDNSREGQCVAGWSRDGKKEKAITSQTLRSQNSGKCWSRLFKIWDMALG